MKVLSLFSGIGAFEKALTNLGIPYELVAYCEIDKYASKSYSAIHAVDESMNLGDITKVDEKALPKDIDLVTYGFPCQDIAVCGKQKGLFNEDGTKTRSGLFFDALRIIEETKPRVAIAENVKNLVSKKFNAQFQIVLASLEAAGYNNHYAVLNAKDFGIPQNRQRVFIVSIRKDIESTFFHLPKGFPLKLRLRDVLEDVVDEKYYLSDKMLDYITTITEKNKARGNGNVYAPVDIDGVSKTVTTKEGSRVKDNFIEELTIAKCVGGIGEKKSNGGTQTKIEVVGNYSPSGHDASRIVSADGLAPTVKENHGTVTAVVEPLVWDGFNQRVKEDQSCVGTITQNVGADLKRNGQGIIEGKRIRKLTPKECFRLMGFDDEDFARAKRSNSNTQLYKQAGNSIVVPVLEHIIETLLHCGALAR
jgi:DNA (cytosine-5)-methyltransferase 1